MKNQNFLRKLCGEGIIQVQEPNVDLASAYFEKARKSLSSAKATASIGSLEDATALSYYAMYHALTGLLFRAGIKCENHTASILLLHEVFEQNNDSILHAKKERIDKQYYVDFAVTQDEVKKSITSAEEFLALISDILAKLTETRVAELNKKAKKLLK